MTPRQVGILDVASTLIGEQGMRTSIEQIAEACDMQAGSLYHHFASKDEICLALVVRYGAELDRIAQRASSDPVWTSNPPLERLAITNGTDYGLNAVGCTRHHPSAHTRLARRFRRRRGSGERIPSASNRGGVAQPFGGINGPGFGREGGKGGIASS